MSKASRGLYQVRSYSIKHGHDVGAFLEAYRQLLQGAIDEIWGSTTWKEKRVKGRKGLIPTIPKENASNAV